MLLRPRYHSIGAHAKDHGRELRPDAHALFAVAPQFGAPVLLDRAGDRRFGDGKRRGEARPGGARLGDELAQLDGVVGWVVEGGEGEVRFLRHVLCLLACESFRSIGWLQGRSIKEMA